MTVLLPEHIEHAAWRRDVKHVAAFLRRSLLRGTFEDALTLLSEDHSLAILLAASSERQRRAVRLTAGVGT